MFFLNFVARDALPKEIEYNNSAAKKNEPDVQLVPAALGAEFV